MDTTRWKSVLVPRHTYDEIVLTAKNEGRTISGHLRIVFELWKKNTLTGAQLAQLKNEIDTLKEEKQASSTNKTQRNIL